MNLWETLEKSTERAEAAACEKQPLKEVWDDVSVGKGGISGNRQNGASSCNQVDENSYIELTFISQLCEGSDQQRNDSACQKLALR